ncbi:haloacid dehalogenase-like hydrolase [Erysipelothrix rhusiopathiae]|uniref:DUF7916 family protein n=1 Tax=Erysipelothrix rhusiopathiae TaxID=1648 RepID=UPI002B253A10|nr:haloacid dehalogenase-like hydrolase [Erysipelothrix rhusiopathiae]WRB92996.1 haloacid dehalogenase-like hydrolase [Erysipelothrix rhusiopathiae]
MMKRLISANTSDILNMTNEELKQSIKASEGRVVLSENYAARESFVGDISNSEIARACGADLILLNGVDVFNPDLFAIECIEKNFVDELHRLVGAPIGVNLEPIDQNADMTESRFEIALGRQATVETIEEIERRNFDFVCFTGNPGTGVTNEAIISTIKIAKEKFSGLIIAGKMHGAGVVGPIIDLKTVEAFIDAGADVILVPAVGTVPGFDANELKEIVQFAHARDTLVMSAIGTSQEGSTPEIIAQMSIQNKICGVDIHHIGDAGYAGLGPVENIFAIGQAIRGIRHTLSSCARSVNR